MGHVEVFQLVLDRVVDQAGGRFKGVLLVAHQAGCLEAGQLLLDVVRVERCS